MKLNTILHTDGSGLWSNAAKKIEVVNAELNASDYSKYGSLNVYFTSTSWSTNRDGLIYTDRQWIKEFRSFLETNKGFSKTALKSVDYSEQGMQGDDFVNLDVGPCFIDEWRQMGFPV